MDDLISREAARDVINTWGRQRSEKVRMELLHRDLDAISAVSAAQVVRCKDCKHLGEEDYCCTLIGAIAKPDWYCADGERGDSK